MKFASSLFDRIRVKPDEAQRVRVRLPDLRLAELHRGPATHRAPKGRLREGQYWRFCLGHVREYNHSYNYFAGMSDEAVARFQKDLMTGHRPTWKMGLAGGPPQGQAPPGRSPATMRSAAMAPPIRSASSARWAAAAAAQPDPGEGAGRPPMVRNAERKALELLGLDVDATTQDIKAKFKELVKRHHPDANGGDRSTRGPAYARSSRPTITSSRSGTPLRPAPSAKSAELHSIEPEPAPSPTMDQMRIEPFAADKCPFCVACDWLQAGGLSAKTGAREGNS